LAADSGRLVESNRWRVIELDNALACRCDAPEMTELHDGVRAAIAARCPSSLSTGAICAGRAPQ
jgi:hypothetical protein